jgi:fatty acid desaturase
MMSIGDTIVMRAVPKELLTPATVPALLGYALTDWSIIAGLWLAAAASPAAFYPLWVVLLAGRLHALGVILHEAVHLPQQRKTATIRLLEILAGYPIGSSIDAMRYHHLRHHRENGLPADPYFKPRLNRWIGASRVRFWLASLRYLLLLPLWMLRGLYGSIAAYAPAARDSYGRLFLQDRYRGDLTHSREVMRCGDEDRWQLLFHAAVFAALIPYRHWLLIYYLIPAVLAGYLAGYRLLVEHTPEPNHDRDFLTTIRSTRDHSLGILGSLLFAPHYVGYHRVHHLHPQASLENLPKLRNWYLTHCPEVYPQ